jgi:TorA maturation chaperone TorD
MSESIDLERSRSMGYGLVARLLLRGLDAERLETVRQLPGLAEALPEALDLDELAAAHYDLFHTETLPYAAEFGGSIDDLMHSYRRGGFTPRLDDVRPDHLGVLFAHLSFLAGARADALEDGEAEAAARVEGLLARFIDRHVLSWVPCYLATALDRPQSLWTAVLVVSWELVVEHREGLPETEERLELPEPALSLDDPKTGLKDVAEFLSNPARCGVFVGRGDITQVSRGANAPRGFGGRRLMIENLLRSAAEYEQAGAVFEALRETISSRAASLIVRGGGRLPSRLLCPWLERIDETMKILATMATASSREVAATPPT